MSESRPSIVATFNAALELPPERRAAYLEAACVGDAQLHHRVEVLLRSYESAGTFLEEPAQPAPPERRGGEPAGNPPATPEDRDDAEVGQSIGRYKLLEKLGEGGCGVVYVAEQTEPVRRRVALKVIKLGMDTKAVVTRFEAERQAMAMMDHANIARIFEAETTEKGRPYFVMELVRGIPITQYCDQASLTTQARLELFIKVCQAIQHAHQKGIIHRDIKPSNILVTLHDGVPVPKVIDFGIAKAIAGRLTEHTVYTQLHQFIGTPAYMSPEQAEMTGLDIDTRSDIYSLGVLLYELLAGRPPFDPKELLSVGLDAMRKIIREQEPARPSTRLATLGAADSTTTAKRRSTDPVRLTHQLRGDLDWIVMKCLEKDRTRRYETANGLAFDIRRHLSDEPVLARPPSAAYRLEKTWRRHRGALSAALLTAVVLVAATSISVWQAISAHRLKGKEAAQRQRADQALEREAAAHQRTEEALIRMELQKSDALFAMGDSSGALAYLARASRRNPSNTLAAPKLFTALSQQQLNLRLAEPIDHPPGAESAEFSPDGRWVVTATADGSARVWDARTGQPVTAPLKHDSRVNTARFSSDGRRVLTASDDGTARVWDAQTGQPLSPPLKHDGGIRSAWFGPDGRRVVTASRDNTARVWDAETGQPVTGPLVHQGEVFCVGFSPDSRWVVTGSFDSTARVWDAETGRPLTPPLQHRPSSGVRSAEFAPDGRSVVTAGGDSTARVWDAQTGQPLSGPLQHGGGAVNSARFSPDGTKVVTASDDGTARVWSARTGEPLTIPLKHELTVAYAEFSPDGKRVVTASADKTARVWDAHTGQPLTAPLVHRDKLVSARFSPDGQRVVTASWADFPRVWDARTGSPRTGPLEHVGADVLSARFSPDGRRVVTASDDGTARIWDAETGRPLTAPLISHVPGSYPAVRFAEFSPDGQRLVTASVDHTAWVWEARTGLPLAARFQHAGPVNSAHFSTNGLRVVTASDDHTARVWDSVTGLPVTPSLQHTDIVRSARFSPDGQRAVTASWDHTARVWDAQTGQLLTPPLQHKGRIEAADFSPDGRWVVTASGDGIAQIWDAHTGRPMGAALAHQGPVLFAQFSPDGGRVVTASADRTAQIWDAQTGGRLAGRLKHEQQVNFAQFSPDGRRVATASEDNTARIWDAETGLPLTDPLKHAAPVVYADFSPDGQRLVTAAKDGTARIWEVPPVPLPAPEWVLKLAEAMADKRLDEEGDSRPVPFRELLALRRQVSESSSADLWTRWAKWAIADPATRTLSPFSTARPPEAL